MNAFFARKEKKKFIVNCPGQNCLIELSLEKGGESVYTWLQWVGNCITMGNGNGKEGCCPQHCNNASIYYAAPFLLDSLNKRLDPTSVQAQDIIRLHIATAG